MKNNLRYGDIKSIRYNLFKYLYQLQLGSGLHTKPDTVRDELLPSDLDEL